MNKDQHLAEVYSRLMDSMDKQADAYGKIKILEPSADKPERDAILLTKLARIVFDQHNIGLILEEQIDTSFRPGEIEWATLKLVDLNGERRKSPQSSNGKPSIVILRTEGKDVVMQPQPYFISAMVAHLNKKLDVSLG